MENNQTTPFSKIILTYGLLFGIVSVLVSVLNYSFGNIYKPHWSLSIINYLLLIAFIVLGLKAYREQNGGLLKLSVALKIGIGISLVAGILSMLYFFVFVNYIEPDFIAKSAEFQEQMLYDRFPDMDEALIEQQLEMTKKFMTPGIMSAFILAASLFSGLIFSLVIGLFMKKNSR